KTLKEARHTTELMSRQLKQNRAYMTPGLVTYVIQYNEADGLQGVIFEVTWDNCGVTTAYRVKRKAVYANVLPQQVPPSQIRLPTLDIAADILTVHPETVGVNKQAISKVQVSKVVIE